MSGTIYLGRDGSQLGPYAWAQIAAMASAGQVRPGDLAWHEGMPNWQSAEAVLNRLGLSINPPVPPRTAAAPLRTQPSPAAGGIGRRWPRLLPGRSVNRP